MNFDLIQFSTTLVEMLRDACARLDNQLVPAATKHIKRPTQ